MKVGPFSVCWLLSDAEIIETYIKGGEKALSELDCDCSDCHDRSCPINTGFAGGRREIQLESKIVVNTVV